MFYVFVFLGVRLTLIASSPISLTTKVYYKPTKAEFCTYHHYCVPNNYIHIPSHWSIGLDVMRDSLHCHYTLASKVLYIAMH